MQLIQHLRKHDSHTKQLGGMRPAWIKVANYCYRVPLSLPIKLILQTKKWALVLENMSLG